MSQPSGDDAFLPALNTEVNAASMRPLEVFALEAVPSHLLRSAVFPQFVLRDTARG